MAGAVITAYVLLDPTYPHLLPASLFAYFVSVFASMNVNFSYGESWLLVGIIFSFFMMRDIFLA